MGLGIGVPIRSISGLPLVPDGTWIAKLSVPPAKNGARTGKSLPGLFRPNVPAFLVQGDAQGYQIAEHLANMRMAAARSFG